MSNYKKFISKLEPLAKEKGYTVEVREKLTPYLCDTLHLVPKNKNKDVLKLDYPEMGTNFALAHKLLNN